MVITKLYGGLGNQMFQYAAGVALSSRLKTNLYLNLDWFDEVKKVPEATQRVYELDGFGIIPKSMTIGDRISSRKNPPKIFREVSFNYQSSFKVLGGNVMLDGYWQSYKYFDEYRQEVLKAFTFPPKITYSNRLLLDKIIKSQSVSIHIRRGDYVSSEHTSKYHGLIPLSYYKKAVANIIKTIKEPVLFVFSDDIEWCKANIKFNIPYNLIDSNGLNSGIEDMRLMALCKHNITANSSFSWWAGWLNPYKDKRVITPYRWFADRSKNTSDLIPQDWAQL